MNELDRLFDALWANTIGFDPVFTRASRPHERAFPHYNIVKNDDDHYVVELALAGYGPDDVEITWLPGSITVSSALKQKDVKDETQVYRGIAKREFRMTLPLAQHVEVGATEFINGLLRVELVRNIPEAAKPRKIAIGYRNEALLTDQSNVVSLQQKKLA